MSPVVPTPFSTPVVVPDTTTLFRREPYISPSEYRSAPTAVDTGNLVPGGNSGDQEAALAAEILRASGWVDEICFHSAAGTLAASLGTESGWVKPKPNGELLLFCNYAPILQLNGVALGRNPQEAQSVGNSEAQAISITDHTIRLPSCELPEGNSFGWQPVANNGKVYIVWTYVSGFPHTCLTTTAKAGATSIGVAASEPGGTEVLGVYPGTQLTIHDDANTEVVVVKEVEGLTLKLAGALLYEHDPPPAPNSIRVSAIPWAVEQACISLTSAIIKKRGSRSLIMPSAPGGTARGTGTSAENQVGGGSDQATAMKLLKPYIMPVLRSST